MGTKYWEVVCDENGIGGSVDYCGEKMRTSAASTCFTTRPRAESRAIRAGENWSKGNYKRAE
jgi:hypothetical protein